MTIDVRPLRTLSPKQALRKLPQQQQFYVRYLFTLAVWDRRQLESIFSKSRTARPGPGARKHGVLILFDPGTRKLGWFAVMKGAVTPEDRKKWRRLELRQKQGRKYARTLVSIASKTARR